MTDGEADVTGDDEFAAGSRTGMRLPVRYSRSSIDLFAVVDGDVEEVEQAASNAAAAQRRRTFMMDFPTGRPRLTSAAEKSVDCTARGGSPT